MLNVNSTSRSSTSNTSCYTLNPDLMDFQGRLLHFSYYSYYSDFSQHRLAHDRACLLTSLHPYILTYLLWFFSFSYLNVNIQSGSYFIFNYLRLFKNFNRKKLTNAGSLTNLVTGVDGFEDSLLFRLKETLSSRTFLNCSNGFA